VGARAPWLSSVVHFKVLGAAGCVPPLPATRLPSWHCPASRSFRVVPLAAFWFATPSPPFLRPRGLRCTTPSGTAVPAAPSGLGVPPGYDLAARADAALKPRGDLPGVPFPYSGHDLPESVCPGGSNLRHDPPSAFHTPSTVCSSNRLPALFRPVPLLGFSLQSFAPLREAARLSAPLPSCRYEQPQSSTLRFFWKIMVLRSYRVLLLPMSPYPAGLPPHCQADALLGLGLFRALSGMPWPALPPAFPLALRLRHIPRRTRRRLCLRASMHDPVRGSIAGPPALMRFSTLSRPRCPLKAPRRFRQALGPPVRGGLPPWTRATRRSRAPVLATWLSKRHFEQARLR